MKYEVDPKVVPLSIQANGQLSSNPSSVYLQQPLICLFIATLNPSIYSNPKSAPSSRRTVFFLGGFVFVAAAVVARTVGFFSGC